MDVAGSPGDPEREVDEALRSLAGAVDGPEEGLPVAIGPFRVLSRIDQGATSVVYLCADPAEPGRSLAVKLVRDLGLASALRHRFAREQDLLAELRHPGIVPIRASGELGDGRPWFAMPFVPGVPLDQWADESGASAHDAIAVLDQACAAVEYAHRKGIIHRDLKPSNVIVVGDEPSRARVHLIDFGLATRRRPAGGASLLGGAVGTPGYMSPEQAAGLPTDSSSDIWSLGALIRRVAHSVGMPAATRREFDLVCVRAQQPDPDRRYASVAALREDLARLRDGRPVRAARIGAWRRISLSVRRQPVMTFVILACAMFAVVALVRASDARRAQQLSIARTLRAEDSMRAMLLAFDERPATQRDAALLRAMLDQAEGAYPLEQPPSPECAQMNLILGHLRHRVGDGAAAMARLEACWRALAGTDERGSRMCIEARLWQADAQGRARIHQGAAELLDGALGDARRTLAVDDPLRLRLESVASTFSLAPDAVSLLPWAVEVRERMVKAGLSERILADHDARTLSAIERGLGRAAFDRIRELRARWDGRLAPEDPILIGMDTTVSVVLDQLGRLDEALALVESLRPRIQQAYGAGSHLACINANNLGWLHYRLGHAREAEQYLTEARDGFTRLYGPDNQLAAMASANLFEMNRPK
jgi:predicted Ser/Thr protein kinase